MKFLKYLVFFFAILCAIAFLLPKDKYISRSVEIDQEIDLVFNQVNTLKNWENWSAWSLNDSSATYEYSTTPSSGKGAWQRWKSNTTGEGKLTIVESDKNKLIKTHLEFYEQGEGAGEWNFSFNNGKSSVEWTYHADLRYNPLARWIGLFLDSMLGQSLEQSLNSLQNYCQNTELDKILEETD